MLITIKGARENNLKNIDVQIPKNKFVVLTGLSGSGKSTLALETLQRECQRQYMESMGMTLDIGSKPKVDSIEGLSPAISINQHQTSNNPRSTVGTVTEITTYLRVLFAKLGKRICSHCGGCILQNYHELQWEVQSSVNDFETNTAETLEETILCPFCRKPIYELTASHFSYNKPQGACSTCHGIGTVNFPNIDLLFERRKSIREFAIMGWDQVYIDRYGSAIVQAANHYGFDINIDLPIEKFNSIQMDLLLYGVLSKQFQEHFPNILPPKTVPEGRFEGIVTNLMRRYVENSSQSARQKIEKFLIQKECPDCHGIRFRKDILNITLADINIKEALDMSIIQGMSWLNMLPNVVTKEALEVVKQALDDVKNRMNRIIDAGAGYLSLNQPAASLSAGEWQRIKLASVLGSGLTGVLYILDEPTSGLHSRDTEKVVTVLKRLRDLGNTVVVIEHDLEVMRAADYIIDFGPGAGSEGGTIVAYGDVQALIKAETSITGKYLQANTYIQRREKIIGNDGLLALRNVEVNNLKSFNVDIPLGRLVAVTGVSGSGKSSLIFGYLSEVAQRYFQNTKKKEKSEVLGLEQLDSIVSINQHSIGRSSRSNAATYTEVFTYIRDLFASLPDTKLKGFSAKDFSYNVQGGRCEKCQGHGKISIAMHFLPDVDVICPMCHGNRYRKPILDILYKDCSISNVLDMSVNQAIELFSDTVNILKKLQTLQDVGLGYLILGQSTSTLSGGEAQRLKLAKELMKAGNGKVLYLFDEPTNGLHPHDVGRLINMFDRLVQRGNSVIVIEHHTEMIAEADWVIDLGPEGGNEGGRIVVEGPLEKIINCPDSFTGKFIADLIK